MCNFAVPFFLKNKGIKKNGEELLPLMSPSVKRREEILKILKQSKEPVSASVLAGRFSVSRQIIVGDIALLRAAAHEISATPRGYILQKGPTERETFTIACRHDDQLLAQELYTVVDNGCGLLDVIVEHPLYGQISGSLQIFSRYDADLFLRKLEENRANPLCALTGGVHLHTLSCPSEEACQRVREGLRKQGILFERPDETDS